MFIPFYDRIEKQEFRKHNEREFIIPETALLTYARQLPAFQYIVSGFSGIDSVELVSISSTGRQLNTHTLQSDYITITDVGDGDYRIGCDGGVLDEPIPFQLFYIKLTFGELVRVSEVFCKIREVDDKGRILLNTGAFLKNNDGGNFLLNDFEKGYVVDQPVQIKYTGSKNYGKFDLNSFVGNFFVNSEINFLRSVEENDSDTFDGLREDFEKIVSSIYSIEFMASRQVCDLLNQLYFFENIEITDKYGCVYVPQEPVSIIKEREEMTGFYNIILEFKINNTLNYSELTTTPDQEDTNIDDYIGMVFDHFGNVNELVLEILPARNADLTNHEWVWCEGQDLLADEHPKAAQILGTKIVGDLAKIQIPDFRGVVCAGIGQYTDSEGYIQDITSEQIGTYSHRLTIAEMAEHFHKKGRKIESYSPDTRGGLLNPITVDSGQTGRGLAHNNMQPTYGVYKIMLIDK